MPVMPPHPLSRIFNLNGFVAKKPTSLSFSPNGSYLSACGDDGCVAILDPDQGIAVQLLLFGGDAYATACTWIDRERILLASSDGRVLSIRLATPGGTLFKDMEWLTHEFSSPVTFLTYDKPRRQVVLGFGSCIEIWRRSFPKWQIVRQLNCNRPSGPVKAAWILDSVHIVAWYRDLGLQLWDCSAGTFIPLKVEGAPMVAEFESVVFSDDQRFILVVAGFQAHLYRFALPGHTVSHLSTTDIPAPTSNLHLASTGTTSTLTCGTKEGVFRRRLLIGGEAPDPEILHSPEVRYVAIAPPGYASRCLIATLATSIDSEYPTLHLWGTAAPHIAGPPLSRKANDQQIPTASIDHDLVEAMRRSKGFRGFLRRSVPATRVSKGVVILVGIAVVVLGVTFAPPSEEKELTLGSDLPSRGTVLWNVAIFLFRSSLSRVTGMFWPVLSLGEYLVMSVVRFLANLATTVISGVVESGQRLGEIMDDIFWRICMLDPRNAAVPGLCGRR